MSTFEKLLKCAQTIVLLALAWTMLVTIPHQLSTAADGLRSDANRQAALTRNAIVDLLTPVAQQVSHLPNDLTRVADARLKQAITVADRKLDRFIATADNRIGEGTQALQEVAAIREDLKPVLAETAATIAAARPVMAESTATIAAARAAVAPEFDCRRNGSCWQSQVTGILGGSKTLIGEGALTMRYWRKETPALAASVSEIAGNGAKISKPHWYWKVAPIVGGVIVGIISAKAK